MLDGTYFYCPVDLTLSVIGGRWKGLVFWNLKDEPKRYGELKRILVGINDKMLSQVLKELETASIIHREVLSAIPPKTQYSLTPEGRRLLPVFRMMSEWGSRYEQTGGG